MGGTPALGGMALPKLSQDQIHGLSNTVSPAARELHAAKGHPVDTSSHSPPTVKTPDASSPPWLVIHCYMRALQLSLPPSLLSIDKENYILCFVGGAQSKEAR